MVKKIEKLKKNKYKFICTKYIDSTDIYAKFKIHLLPLIEKYHKFNGHPMLFSNTPIAAFAEAYYLNKELLLNNLDESAFIKWSCELYNLHTQKYKLELFNRISKIVDSIKLVGYNSGKFKGKLICLSSGVHGHFGNVDDGFELISGKHRAAACLAVGLTRIKCNIYQGIDL